MEKLIYLDTAVSTNDYAKALAQQGAPHGTAVLAKSQTAGRGRMGRSFLSPEGGLYLSVILRPREKATELMHLTAVLAAAACDAVEEICGVRPGVKWINDLVLGGKKLAGILTELAVRPDGTVDYAVCGIGINCGAVPDEVREIAAALPGGTDISALAEAVVRHWLAACDTIEDPAHMEKYRRLCVTLGRPVRVMAAEPYEAEAVDVDESGALVVRRENGEICRVFSGEVSVRGLYGYV